MSVRDFAGDLFAVAWSEFHQFRRNRAAMLISLVILPVFFIFALGAGIGPSGGAETKRSPAASVQIAFVDNDKSLASAQLLYALSKSGDFDNLVEGYAEEAAISALGNGRIYAAIIIPDGFQKELFGRRSPSIVLYVDDSEPGLSEAVLSSLRKHVQAFSSAEAAQVKVFSKGRIISSFNAGFAIVLGVVQIFATFYEIAGGMSRGREGGTYARLLLTRASVWAVLLGKTVYDSMLGIIRTLLIIGVAIYAYGAHPNTDVATILFLSLLIGLLTMGFAFFVSAFGVGVRTVVILEFFLILFIMGFSGMTIERELLGGVPKTISTILPWSYGFDALRQTILRGEPLMNIGFDLQWMAVAILLFYISAYMLLVRARERLIG